MAAPAPTYAAALAALRQRANGDLPYTFGIDMSGAELPGEAWGTCPLCGGGRLKIEQLAGGGARIDCLDGCKPSALLEVLGLEAESVSPAGRPSTNGTPPVDASLVAIASVRRARVEWAYARCGIPAGMLTLVLGDPGLGKSLFTCHVATHIAASGGHVVLVTAEDSLEVTVRPRLEAAGADLDRIHALKVRRDGVDDGLELPDDAELLERLVIDRDVRLVVIDPLSAHLPETVNSWRDQSVRRALAPLHRLAEAHGCAVIVVAHLNKSGGRDPLLRAGGSIGIPAAARSALLLARDPDDPDGERGTMRVLAHVKCNVGEQVESLACRVDRVDLPGDEKCTTARLVMVGTSGTTAGELLATSTSEERTERDEAAEFLRTELADGPMPAKEVQAAARGAGIAERTLARAKAQLGVRSQRVGGAGADGHWQWSLNSATQPGTVAESGTGEVSANPHGEQDPDPSETATVPSQTDGTVTPAEGGPAPRCSCKSPAEPLADGLCSRCYGRPVTGAQGATTA